MNQKNKDVVVVIPIYKNDLDPFEKTSLYYCKHNLNNHYILVISPQSLSKDQIFLDFLKKEKLKVHYFEDSFFDGINGYNSLMLNLNFYKTFFNYQYMLIYQLDVLVFSNNLLQWAQKGYDYIGAPILTDEDVPSLETFGNGGLSLRKIQTFIDVLETKKLFYSQSKFYRTPYRVSIKYMFIIRILNSLKKYNIPLDYLKIFLYFYKNNEDHFWSYCAKFFTREFQLPSAEESLKFSFEVNPSLSFTYNKNILPFGAHAWNRYDLDFWLNHIPELNEKLNLYREETNDGY